MKRLGSFGMVGIVEFILRVKLNRNWSHIVVYGSKLVTYHRNWSHIIETGHISSKLGET